MDDGERSFDDDVARVSSSTAAVCRRFPQPYGPYFPAQKTGIIRPPAHSNWSGLLNLDDLADANLACTVINPKREKVSAEQEILNSASSGVDGRGNRQFEKAAARFDRPSRAPSAATFSKDAPRTRPLRGTTCFRYCGGQACPSCFRNSATLVWLPFAISLRRRAVSCFQLPRS